MANEFDAKFHAGALDVITNAEMKAGYLKGFDSAQQAAILRELSKIQEARKPSSRLVEKSPELKS